MEVVIAFILSAVGAHFGDIDFFVLLALTKKVDRNVRNDKTHYFKVHPKRHRTPFGGKILSKSS